jgi:pimeloyl-CoA synthetase
LRGEGERGRIAAEKGNGIALVELCKCSDEAFMAGYLEALLLGYWTKVDTKECED